MTHGIMYVVIPLGSLDEPATREQAEAVARFCGPFFAHVVDDDELTGALTEHLVRRLAVDGNGRVAVKGPEL